MSDRRPKNPRPSGPGPLAPRGPAGPIGRDRASVRSDAPPRPSRAKAAPPRPDLPDTPPRGLPRSASRQITRLLGDTRRASDVIAALAVASEAIEQGELATALECLEWARHEAPKAPVIREALGVARYLDEDYAAAVSELQTYRRLSGRVDQNHLLADGMRAQGKPLDHIEDICREAYEHPRAADDRRAEAAVVWAAALEDAGRRRRARSLLDEAARLAPSDETSLARVHELAAHLAALDGDEAAARRSQASAARLQPELELRLVEDEGDVADQDPPGEPEA